MRGLSAQRDSCTMDALDMLALSPRDTDSSDWNAAGASPSGQQLPDKFEIEVRTQACVFVEKSIAGVEHHKRPPRRCAVYRCRVHGVHPLARCK